MPQISRTDRLLIAFCVSTIALCLYLMFIDRMNYNEDLGVDDDHDFKLDLDSLVPHHRARRQLNTAQGLYSAGQNIGNETSGGGMGPLNEVPGDNPVGGERQAQVTDGAPDGQQPSPGSGQQAGDSTSNGTGEQAAEAATEAPKGGRPQGQAVNTTWRKHNEMRNLPNLIYFVVICTCLLFCVLGIDTQNPHLQQELLE